MWTLCWTTERWAEAQVETPVMESGCGHAVSHRKTRCVFFKPWGSNLSQFFRIQFKGVRLELLAPILSWRIQSRWLQSRSCGILRELESGRESCWQLVVSWLWGPPGLASIIHSVALNPPEDRQPLTHSSFSSPDPSDLPGRVGPPSWLYTWEGKSRTSK